MKLSIRSLTLALALTSASLFGAAAAQAQTVITSLPYTITTKGLYVLNSDLNATMTSGTLITIQASNVTIDFQGHYIAGAVGSTSQTTFGIYAFEQSNITIKNGTIAYCYKGIDLEGNGTTTTNSVDQVVDNMRMTYIYGFGIVVYQSPASRITNCQVSQGGFSGSSYAAGIICNSDSITIQNNVVSKITATTSYGIFAGTGSFIRENTVSGCGYGVIGGKYQDNLTGNCTTPYSGGTDAGGNN